MPAAALTDRGVVKVAGVDSRGFLQGLITNDVEKLPESEGRYAALLTPQGKIVVDFLLSPARDDLGGGFFVDLPRPLVGDFIARLSKYRLRAKVAIEDMSESIAVVAAWGLPERPAVVGDIYRDPRHPDLGWRIFCVESEAPGVVAALGAASPEAYDAHRIGLGAPRGGVDFAYGDAFPHEADMDRFAGIDFRKGCYVGQEVVSRVEHRGLARKRVTPVTFAGARPEVGVELRAGETAIGVMGSSIAGRGLAMLRLDKAAEAKAAGRSIMAGGVQVEPQL
ncbi:MAG: folate-binding protein YgfZ [Methylobacteriaceae bacterium]|nr:folate-binding protein YgfZ [Methylobacteriaceae bacterium]